MTRQIVMSLLFIAVLTGSAAASYTLYHFREPLRERFAAYDLPAPLKTAYDTGLGQALASFKSASGWAQQRFGKMTGPPPQHFAKAAPIVVPDQTPLLTLSEMQAMKMKELAQSALEPASGAAPAAVPEVSGRWTPDQQSLSVEAVLVPRQITVISSSQDGRIAKVLVGQGDRFRKGDVLIEYDCADLEAEAAIAGMQKNLTAKKNAGVDELFKLNIISDVDRIGAQVEDRQASARIKLYDARMDHCRIRAEFDGRVSNRLANPGEYTRTDRVLMEVASDEPLQAEFLLPSKWLRWVNVGAPVSITINETDATYPAKISRIYGKVDPVSQSVQMVALLDKYDDPLLPGMSGQAKLSVPEIQKSGVRGYLQISAGP